MDWNWYFGALAQSAAAIVGIFGAFIITKVLSNQSNFAQKSNRAKELLAESQRVVDSANDLSIEWYLERKIEDELDDLNDRFEDDDTLPAETYYDKLNFPHFLDRERAIAIIKDAAEERRRRIAKEEEQKRREAEERAKAGPYGLPNRLDFNPSMALNGIRNSNVQNQVEREREAINTVIRDARHQVRALNDFLDTIRGNPEFSPQITYTLLLVAILFFSGVIYPLSFLPMPMDGAFELSFAAFWPLLFSLKGALLAVVSVVFMSVLGMFFWLNLSLRYADSLVDDLSRFTTLGSYSQYFEIMEKNERAGAAAHDGKHFAAGDD